MWRGGITSIANTPVRRPIGTAMSAFEGLPKARPTTTGSIVALYTPLVERLLLPDRAYGETGTPACASVSAASRVDQRARRRKPPLPKRGVGATGKCRARVPDSVLAALRAAAFLLPLWIAERLTPQNSRLRPLSSRGCFIERLLEAGRRLSQSSASSAVMIVRRPAFRAFSRPALIVFVGFGAADRSARRSPVNAHCALACAALAFAFDLRYFVRH